MFSALSTIVYILEHIFELVYLKFVLQLMFRLVPMVFRIPLLRFLSTKTKFIQTKYSINEVPIPDIYLARIFTDFDNFQIRYCARLKFVVFYAIPLSERNSIQTVKFISVPVNFVFIVIFLREYYNYLRDWQRLMQESAKTDKSV